MRSRAALLLALGVAVGAFALTWRGRALASARSRLESEKQALAQVQGDLDHLQDLRARRATVAAGKRPAQDVIAQVNAAMREAGLPSARFKNLEPESDTKLAERYRLQTLRVSFEKMSVPELGALLAEWRRSEGVWTPASIELTHVNAAEGRADLFDVRVLLAATYLSDAPETVP